MVVSASTRDSAGGGCTAHGQQWEKCSVKAAKAKKTNGSFRVVSLKLARCKRSAVDIIHNASLVNRP